VATYPVGSDKAFQQPQDALDAAGAANDYNARIPVDSGTYVGNLTLRTHPSTYVMPVHIYAADPANKPVFQSTTGSYALIADVATHSSAGTLQPTFTNIKWSGGSAATYHTYSNGGAPLRFYGCEFISQFYGKQIFYQPYGGTAGRGWVIDSCWFYNPGQIVFNSGGGVGTLTNNRIRWYNGSQTMIQAGFSTWTAYNNSVASGANGGTLFVVGTARNNAVSRTGGSSPTKLFDTFTGGGSGYGNNVFSWGGTNSGTNLGGNVTNADPGFADPENGDFSITTSSACYNAGATLSDVTTDHRGTARPQGASYDVGAYELIPGTTVSSITVVSSTSIRLNLASSVGSDATWASAGNFTITSGTGSAVTVSSAAASGNPGSSITLTTSEHTNGATYTVAWAGLLNITSGSTTYTGQGVAPTISTASFTAAVTMRVTFSEAVTNNAALTTASNYTLTPTAGAGFHPTAVTRISSTVVDLTIDRSLGASTGSLAVSGVTDLAGNALSPSTKSITVWTVQLDGATGRLEGGASFVRLALNAPVFRDAATWVGSSMTIAPYLNARYYGVDGSPATYVDFVTSDSSVDVEYGIAVNTLLGVNGDSLGFIGARPATSAGVDAGEPARISYFTGPNGEAI